jgi:hypothetical protein
MGWFGFFKCTTFNMVEVNNTKKTVLDLAHMCMTGIGEKEGFPSWHYTKCTDSHPHCLQDIGFRATAYAFDWCLLLTMSFLNQVNYFFLNENLVKKLEDEAYKNIRDGGSSTYGASSLFEKLKIYSRRFFKYFVLMIMCKVNLKAQTNLITWIFWV